MFFLKKKKYSSYAELPAKEQDKIVIKSIRGANKEQLDLVRKYERSEAKGTGALFF